MSRSRRFAVLGAVDGRARDSAVERSRARLPASASTFELTVVELGPCRADQWVHDGAWPEVDIGDVDEGVLMWRRSQQVSVWQCGRLSARKCGGWASRVHVQLGGGAVRLLKRTTKSPVDISNLI